MLDHVHRICWWQAIEKWGDWGRVAPGLANGQAEIKFTKLEFHRPASVANQFAADEGFTGLVQAVVFEVNDRELIGYGTPQGRRYCCTKERLIYQVRSPADSWWRWLSNGSSPTVRLKRVFFRVFKDCTLLRSSFPSSTESHFLTDSCVPSFHDDQRVHGNCALMSPVDCFCVPDCVQENQYGWPKVMDIYFENNDTKAYSWEEAITIEETGMYYLWFVICDEDLSSAMVRGTWATWRPELVLLP
jgi:hypothetical protein